MVELFLQRCQLFIIGVGLSLIMASYASSYQINADPLVQRSTYLDGFLIWSNLVSDIGFCATLCIRMKMCVSFNFDLSTGKCDLNSELLENHLYNGKSGQNLLYSRRQDWPSETDPDCFVNPCELDEVCIPSRVASIVSISNTSTCMKAKGSRATTEHSTVTRTSSFRQTTMMTTEHASPTLTDSTSMEHSKVSETSSLSVTTTTTTIRTSTTSESPRTTGQMTTTAATSDSSTAGSRATTEHSTVTRTSFIPLTTKYTSPTSTDSTSMEHSKVSETSSLSMTTTTATIRTPTTSESPRTGQLTTTATTSDSSTAGPLAKPTNLKACALDDSSIVLTWSYDSLQDGLFFIVTYMDEDLNVVNATTTLHIIIQDIDDGIQIFRVRAETPSSTSDWSDIFYDPTTSAETGLELVATYGNSSYSFFSKEQVTWTEALTACQDTCGHLVEIHSFEEDLFITGKITEISNDSPHQKWWTGGVYSENIADFVWMSTNSTVGPYTNWQSASHGGNKYCMVIRQNSYYPNVAYRWRTAFCDDLFSFICEI